MSHIASGILQSGIVKGTSSSTQKQNQGTQNFSKIGNAQRDKDKKKDSRNKPGFSGNVNTGKSEYESMFESRDGETYRKPKPLISAEMRELAKQRKELINAQLNSRQDKFNRPGRDVSQTRSNLDAGQKDSSRDKSSDSNKGNTTSQLDVDTSKRMSDNDASEDDRNKKKVRHAKREQLRMEDPEQNVFLTLSETATITVLHIPSMIIPNEDTENVERQVQANNTYATLLKNKVGSDNFSEHASQVLMMPLKEKVTMTEINFANPGLRASGTQVYPYDIDKEVNSEQKTALEVLSIEMKAQIEHELQDKLRDPFALIPTDLRSIEMNGEVQKYHQIKEAAKGAVKNIDKDNDRNPKQLTNYLKAGDTTAKVSELQGGQTETMKGYSKSQHNQTSVINQKLNDFKNSLENENKHLILTEEENNMYTSGRVRLTQTISSSTLTSQREY